jgi:hypothetical protein
MTPSQRQAAFERLLTQLSRTRARDLGRGYAGTIRKLAPPPLPGEKASATRYFVNTVALDGSRRDLFELGAAADAQLRRAETWAETGEGTPLSSKGSKLKRKV